ncbi:MAG: hypothetical protein ACREVC_11125 [Burkholderiales bacterium]
MIQSLEELIVPGRVLRLFCSFTNPPKEKYVVIVATNPFCLGFLINSSATELQESKKHLSDELIPIGKADGYDFLTNPQPSVLDCTYAADLDLDEMVAQLTQDPSRSRGVITDATRKQIIEIMKESMTLEGGIAKIIVKNLSGS